jgi:Pyruvate/2-oxoacid:ferredoxin oxidoreductase delta subunit
VDRWLSLLKYPILVIILVFTYRTAELVFRGYDPCYALISRHGQDITHWAYVVTGVILVASLMIVMPFCRWLCPLAAVLNPFSRFGLTRIKRDEESCISCGECTAVCPTAIPIDRVRQVTAARCLSCLNCIEACPSRHDGAIHWGPPARLGRSWPMGALIAILLFCTSAAVATTYLLPIPSFIKTRGDQPAVTAAAELRIHNLACRGNANLLVYYLERDDVFALSGYLKLEAWPGPGAAKVRITYEPSRCSEAALQQAITEPYYDDLVATWRPSPFQVEGHDPLALEPVDP